MSLTCTYKTQSINKQLGSCKESNCTGRCSVPCFATYEFVKAVCLYFTSETKIPTSEIRFGLVAGHYVECIFNVYSCETEKRKAIFNFFQSCDLMCYYYEDSIQVILRSTNFKTAHYTSICDMSSQSSQN